MHAIREKINIVINKDKHTKMKHMWLDDVIYRFDDVIYRFDQVYSLVYDGTLNGGISLK